MIIRIILMIIIMIRIMMIALRMDNNIHAMLCRICSNAYLGECWCEDEEGKEERAGNLLDFMLFVNLQYFKFPRLYLSLFPYRRIAKERKGTS